MAHLEPSRLWAPESKRWVYLHIEGKLTKLGVSVSATTIRDVLAHSGWYDTNQS